MYSLTSANRYYLYQGFVRMNLGIDGLFKIIRSQMKELSPISGDIFLFFGKNRQSVKILRWDGDGFLLYYKRLEGGSFELPTFNPHTGNYEISYQVLSFILNGVSLKSVRLRKRFYRKLNVLYINCLILNYHPIILADSLIFCIFTP